MMGKPGPEDAKPWYHPGSSGQLSLCLMQASALLCPEISNSFKSPFNHFPELTGILGKAESET